MGNKGGVKMEVSNDIADIEIEILSKNCRFSETVEQIPDQVKRVIENGWWKERRPRKMSGKEFRYGTFGEFVEDHPPQGLGIKLDMLKKLCEDDPEALVAIREASTNIQGKHHSNNITMRQQETAARGTYKDYTLYRIKQERPDLYERVLNKEMSANKAAIEAGFRKKMVSVEASVDGFVKAIRRKFSDDEVAEIAGMLSA